MNHPGESRHWQPQSGWDPNATSQSELSYLVLVPKSINCNLFTDTMEFITVSCSRAADMQNMQDWQAQPSDKAVV